VELLGLSVVLPLPLLLLSQRTDERDEAATRTRLREAMINRNCECRSQPAPNCRLALVFRIRHVWCHSMEKSFAAYSHIQLLAQVRSRSGIQRRRGISRMVKRLRTSGVAQSARVMLSGTIT